MTAGRSKPPQDWHFGKSLIGMLADPAFGSGFPLLRKASQMGLKMIYNRLQVAIEIITYLSMYLS